MAARGSMALGMSRLLTMFDLGDMPGALEGGVGRRLVAERPVEDGVVGRRVMELRRSRSAPCAASTTAGSSP